MAEFLATAAVVVTALLLAAGLRQLVRQRTQKPATLFRLWCAGLPEVASTAYDEIVSQANSSFAMFSVALNDALSARREEERLVQPLLEMSGKLLGRFQMELEALAKLLLDSSRTLHQLPDVQPLAAEDFRMSVTVRLVRRLALLHTILLSSRMRFFQKLADIERVSRRLAGEYEAAVDVALADGGRSAVAWETLDAVQYDLNTLWQEMQITLKVVLHLLPEATAAALPARYQIELAEREAAFRPVPRTSRTHVR